MIYLKLENDKNEKSSYINKLYNIFFPKIKEEKFDNNILITITNTEKNTLKKLEKYMKINGISKICISENLAENEKIKEFLLNQKIYIFNGRWLFKHLITNVTEYICDAKQEKLFNQEISILSNEINKVIYDAIEEIAKKVKVLNIVTNNEKKFNKLEKELYEKNGIILNVTNNYKKSLSKSDIIFNFDFNEELNQYNINSKACIVNLDKDVNLNIKAFSGLNINFYEIILPRKYLRNSLILKGFNDSILYESYIYKNTLPQNIKKTIKDDKLVISFLKGNNGNIRKKEYIKISKKIAN